MYPEFIERFIQWKLRTITILENRLCDLSIEFAALGLIMFLEIAVFRNCVMQHDLCREVTPHFRDPLFGASTTSKYVTDQFQTQTLKKRSLKNGPDNFQTQF